MTFRELINITNGELNLNSLIKYTCENDRVEPKMELFLAPDAEVELHYHFWHHMTPNFPEDDIQHALDNKDFSSFIRYQACWGYDYLPLEVWILYNGEYIGDAILKYSYGEQLFNNITFAESECG